MAEPLITKEEFDKLKELADKACEKVPERSNKIASVKSKESHARNLLIWWLHTHRKLSVAHIAELTGLTKVTVSTNIKIISIRLCVHEDQAYTLPLKYLCDRLHITCKNKRTLILKGTHS